MKNIRKKFTPLVIIMLIVLIVYTLSLFGLLAWSGMSSFKTRTDFRDFPYSFPELWRWQNYPEVFKHYYVSDAAGNSVGLVEMLLNTLVVTITQAAAATVVPLVTAYICARFRFKFSGFLRSIVLITMIVPIVGNTTSSIDMQMTVGIYDNLWFQWIAVAHFLGMYYLVFYGIFRGMSDSYVEAAKIDGASNFRVMIQISFPLVMNTVWTVFLLNFIGYWNDYQGPLIYLPSYPTIATGFFTVVKITAPDPLIDTWPHKFASTTIILAPILTLFLIFQKRLMGSLTLGGVKG